MTYQDLLILSFFDKDILRKMTSKDLTSEMIEAGIGSDASATFAYQDLVCQLRDKKLLVLYRDLTKAQSEIVRAVEPELLILSDIWSLIIAIVSTIIAVKAVMR